MYVCLSLYIYVYIYMFKYRYISIHKVFQNMFCSVCDPVVLEKTIQNNAWPKFKARSWECLKPTQKAAHESSGRRTPRRICIDSMQYRQ